MKVHAQLKITITEEPGLKMDITGCSQCLIVALAHLYETDETFRNVMRKAALINTEKEVSKMCGNRLN